MLHAPGESGTRSLLHLKFSSEAWHRWVCVLKLVRNREWYGGEICWSSYPMLVVKVTKLEPAACEYCKNWEYCRAGEVICLQFLWNFGVPIVSLMAQCTKNI
ncbi:hypothetical protein CY35_06G064700 [Sphagnum magellanicum]|nr:hypothetical protein CY35_06G064700 [Sphagnum magellanicum]